MEFLQRLTAVVMQSQFDRLSVDRVAPLSILSVVCCHCLFECWSSPLLFYFRARNNSVPQLVRRFVRSDSDDDYLQWSCLPSTEDGVRQSSRSTNIELSESVMPRPDRPTRAVGQLQDVFTCDNV